MVKGQQVHEVKYSISISYCSTLYAAPGDYTSQSAPFFFDTTTTRACLTIPIIDDNIVEDPEDLVVTIITDNPQVSVPISASPVIILDNDRVVIGFEMEVYSAMEGQGEVELCAVLFEGSLEISVEVGLVSMDLTARGKGENTV